MAQKSYIVKLSRFNERCDKITEQLRHKTTRFGIVVLQN